jgi:hypothetical protein
MCVCVCVCVCMCVCVCVCDCVCVCVCSSGSDSGERTTPHDDDWQSVLYSAFTFFMLLHAVEEFYTITTVTQYYHMSFSMDCVCMCV